MKALRMALHIAFRMKDGETKEQAEDRLLDVLEKCDEHYVASWSESDVEEYDDET